MPLQRSRWVLPRLAGCWITASPVVADMVEAGMSASDLPQGLEIGPDGFATILEAPPVPYPDEPPANPNSNSQGPESIANPDEATHQAAVALNEQLSMYERGIYVGGRIIRDPHPRFAFTFRQDGADILARYTSDDRFVAEDGGVSTEELQPIYDEWASRFAAHRISGGGHIDPFAGVVSLGLSVDEAFFREVAEAEGWELPPPESDLR